MLTRFLSTAPRWLVAALALGLAACNKNNAANNAANETAVLR